MCERGEEMKFSDSLRKNRRSQFAEIVRALLSERHRYRTKSLNSELLRVQSLIQIVRIPQDLISKPLMRRR